LSVRAGYFVLSAPHREFRISIYSFHTFYHLLVFPCFFNFEQIAVLIIRVDYLIKIYKDVGTLNLFALKYISHLFEYKNDTIFFPDWCNNILLQFRSGTWLPFTLLNGSISEVFRYIENSAFFTVYVIWTLQKSFKVSGKLMRHFSILLILWGTKSCSLKIAHTCNTDKFSHIHAIKRNKFS